MYLACMEQDWPKASGVGYFFPVSIVEERSRAAINHLLAGAKMHGSMRWSLMFGSLGWCGFFLKRHSWDTISSKFKSSRFTCCLMVHTYNVVV